jgi:glycosyltransferase involved in cell wall biosynthesis
MADDEVERPLVSVGIPLCRSRRFLDVIVGNLEAIAYGNVEVIVSDRHGDDDTLEVLRCRFGADRRFRFLAATDGLNWVEHYNLLLRAARGRYAVLFPHDDSYPASYIGELVTALEARPDAVLAFGGVERLSLEGFLPVPPFSPPPMPPRSGWALGASLRMLTLWQLWIAFRGMVRCDVVRRSNLYLRETRGNVRADIYWVFALSLRGRLLYVPSCTCTRRFHRTSTGAGWRYGLAESLNACRVLRSYLNDFAPSRRDALIGQMVVIPWCLVQPWLPRGTGRRVLALYARRRAHADRRAS